MYVYECIFIHVYLILYLIRSRCGRADSVLDSYWICTPQVPCSRPGWYSTF